MYANSRHVKHGNLIAFHIQRVCHPPPSRAPPPTRNPSILTFPFCIPQHCQDVRTIVVRSGLHIKTKAINLSSSGKNGKWKCEWEMEKKLSQDSFHGPPLTLCATLLILEHFILTDWTCLRDFCLHSDPQPQRTGETGNVCVFCRFNWFLWLILMSSKH